ncbi:MAG: hypothetical protein RMI89_10315 [Gloeomargarita sp. SKYBB_i_bin120]|nr:hypothetical protein [Gloeomargarita sp. SKYG98]MCS7293344.1 hypothetical protein [Gloeomargarita sp. SKYB120]MDW8178909.1 hypothetical protein [Gloeomargarita sp. SKYBB_i_bin120]
MSDTVPIPLYPQSTLLHQCQAGQDFDRVYGTTDLLPKVVNFYSRCLGEPQELEARALKFVEETIMPQMNQISWVITRMQEDMIVYHRLGLTPVLKGPHVTVMGATSDKIAVDLGAQPYKTLICIGQKRIFQTTPLRSL